MSKPDAGERHELTYAEAAALAFRLHTQQRLDEAEVLYTTLLEANPDDPTVMHYRGVLMHQTGRQAEALPLIERSLAADGTVAAWHNNYGNVLLDAGRFEDAAAAYRRCAELDASNADVLCNLGVMYRRLKQFDLAEKMLTRAVEAEPELTAAHLNLAGLFGDMGRLDEALAQTVAALKLFPRDARVRKMLGTAYGQMGRLEEAADVYREWLALEPDSESARHHLAGCTGVDVPDRAQDSYVEALFDGFARSFDANLEALQYRAPQLIGDAIVRLLPPADKQLRILDAGCGTGLCGPFLAPYANVLVGVDLSAQMIARARARNVYDSFEKAELVACMESVTDRFDVIVSADTLCYFGRLESAARSARHALNPGGLLMFTVEARAEGPDYQLHVHGRYSHRTGYVRAVLVDAGFEVVELTDVVLRTEWRQPVAGVLAVARAAVLPER